MGRPPRFIVIDDDLINNMVCHIVIKNASGESEIKIFNIPKEGLEYFTNEYSNNANPTVLFLDINMSI